MRQQNQLYYKHAMLTVLFCGDSDTACLPPSKFSDLPTVLPKHPSNHALKLPAQVQKYLRRNIQQKKSLTVEQIGTFICLRVLQRETTEQSVVLRRVQLRKYQKDLKYRLKHHFSKFIRSVFRILQPISYFFGASIAWFFVQKLDHDLRAIT